MPGEPFRTAQRGLPAAFGPSLMGLLVTLGPDRWIRDYWVPDPNVTRFFRLLQGNAPHDARIGEIIQTLTGHSPDFVRLWERHDVRRKRLECKRFHHRDVGELTLSMQAFDVKSSPGQELVVYHADPGSTSAEALTLLGTLAATRAHERPYT